MRQLAIYALLVVLLPVGIVEARHQTGGIDTSDLDDDIVKDLPIPILFGVDYADINPDFGDDRDGGDRTHEGQDMFARKGAPIVSPTDAIVTSVGKTDRDSAGKYVYTVNPGGESFRYMHLDTVANIERGDELEAGDFIGTVGDTGNAPEGVYHLHFEVRDEDRDALDPYERLEGEFTLKEKISFLPNIFSNIRNDEEYAEFLVETYASEFSDAIRLKYKLPNVITEVLTDSGIGTQINAEAKLAELLINIPKILIADLEEGDSGPLVQLLQLYLIYYIEGDAVSRLAASGATGYFGPVTKAVLIEYQDDANIKETGIYDAATRAALLRN